MLWTASGRLWTWGNSEYGQCLLKGQAINQIRTPTEATDDLARSVEGKVVDVQFGGSFVVILDGESQHLNGGRCHFANGAMCQAAGFVYTAGFGALGQGKDKVQSLLPTKILANATSISAGLEQASAVIRDPSTRAEHIMVWGLNTSAGRLGIGMRKPWPSFMVASRFTPQETDEERIWEPCPVSNWRKEWTGKGSPGAGVRAVAHGRDVMWVLVEDGKDEVGRWAGK